MPLHNIFFNFFHKFLLIFKSLPQFFLLFLVFTHIFHSTILQIIKFLQGANRLISLNSKLVVFFSTWLVLQRCLWVFLKLLFFCIVFIQNLNSCCCSNRIIRQKFSCFKIIRMFLLQKFIVKFFYHLVFTYILLR